MDIMVVTLGRPQKSALQQEPQGDSGEVVLGPDLDHSQTTGLPRSEGVSLGRACIRIGWLGGKIHLSWEEEEEGSELC